MGSGCKHRVLHGRVTAHWTLLGTFMGEKQKTKNNWAPGIIRLYLGYSRL